MEIENWEQAVERLKEWARSSEHILGRIIPSVLRENDALKQRIGSAEGEAARLRVEVEGLRREMARLHDEIAHMICQYAETSDLVQRDLAEIARLTNELTLKVKQRSE